MSEQQRERRKRGIGGKRNQQQMCKRTQKIVRANTTETPSYTSLAQYNKNSHRRRQSQDYKQELEYPYSIT